MLSGPRNGPSVRSHEGRHPSRNCVCDVPVSRIDDHPRSRQARPVRADERRGPRPLLPRIAGTVSAVRQHPCPSSPDCRPGPRSVTEVARLLSSRRALETRVGLLPIRGLGRWAARAIRATRRSRASSRLRSRAQNKGENGPWNWVELGVELGRGGTGDRPRFLVELGTDHGFSYWHGKPWTVPDYVLITQDRRVRCADRPPLSRCLVARPELSQLPRRASAAPGRIGPWPPTSSPGDRARNARPETLRQP